MYEWPCAQHQKASLQVHVLSPNECSRSTLHIPATELTSQQGIWSCS